ACYSLLSVVQAGADHGNLPVLVLTSRSVDVTGAEPIDPLKATVHGFARSVAQETPQQVCRVIDVGDAYHEDELASEVALWRQPEVVALRGSRRWLRHETPFSLGE